MERILYEVLSPVFPNEIIDMIVDFVENTCMYIDRNGSQRWYIYKDKMFIQHRRHGPAVIHKRGGMEYWYLGKLHRQRGPAIYRGKLQIWIKHGFEIKRSMPSDYQLPCKTPSPYFIPGELLKQVDKERYDFYMSRSIEDEIIYRVGGISYIVGRGCLYRECDLELM